jgi:hypothetical protein
MVTMHRGPNWKISVYGRDHGLPQFHVEGPGFRAWVAIATLEVVIGTVPAAALRAALVWAEENRELLLATWQELNP